MNGEEILYGYSTALPGNREHFHRPRIHRLLSEAVSCSLTIVTAGAGWGKTQAVSSYLRQADIDFIWVKLSKLDNYTIRFWESFAHAAGIRCPVFGAWLKSSEFPQSEALFYNFLHKFAGSISVSGRLVLVLDDFHLITESGVIHFIEKLLWAHLKNLSVILIGRTYPSLQPQGLYADGSIRQVNEEELRFTKKEAADYYAQQSISLSEPAFKKIYAKTEGWIAAVYLIGLSFKKKGGNTQDAIFLAKRWIHSLIDSEIYSEYPEPLQRCLIELSLFENIPESALAGYSSLGLNLLEEIEKNNLFIRFNPATKTYDIHHLFLDFLIEKRSGLSKTELMEAHRKVADWYYDGGAKLNALSHYQECGNHERIWDIIRYYDVMMPIDMADRFLELIDGFPKSFSKEHPLVSVVHANLMLYKGEIAACLKELQSVVNTYEAMPPSAENLAVAGEAYLFMGIVSMLSYDYKFVEYYKKADACLPGGSVLIDRRLGFSRGNYMMLVSSSASGEYKRFTDAIMEAMPHGVRAMNGAGYGVKYVTMAEAAYYTGDMKTAEDCCYKAISQAKRNGQLVTICAAYSILLRLYLGAGNYEKAVTCVEELGIESENADSVSFTEYYIVTRDIMMGWYYTRLGAYEKVPEWILNEENRGLSPNALGRESFIKAFSLLEEEKYYELFALLENLEIFYDRIGVLPGRIEVLVYKSVLFHKTGETSKSLQVLRYAYDLADGNSLFMLFIELGKHMRTVIDNARHSAENTIPKAWLDEIYTKTATYAKHINNMKTRYQQAATPAVSIERIITRREKEVLCCLCQGMSSREIADNLYISINTVKKALWKIYKKLGASNKADAVRIFMQLGLHK